MSTRKSRAPSGSENDNSSAASLPPVPRRERSRHGEDQYVSPKKQRRRSRYASGRGYDMPREKPPSRVDLLLCVSEGAPSHSWRTAPLTFDRKRADDRELWEDIQRIYRDELQGPWRRIFGFKKLKHILPVEVGDPFCGNFVVDLDADVKSTTSTPQMAFRYLKIPRTSQNLKLSCTLSTIQNGSVPNANGLTGSRSSKPRVTVNQLGWSFRRVYGQINWQSSLF